MFSQHDGKYAALGRLTWDQNKLIYAKKHGYATHLKTDAFKNGFDKMHMAKQILTDHPEYEWIWWTGCDSIITNMNIRIEDRIMNQYHFIVAVDVNGINADSILFRNSPEGREILDDILALEPECEKFWDTEQRAVCLALGVPIGADPSWPPPGPITMNSKYADIAKIMPQKYMNSFNYQFYREYTDQRDKSGVDGNWSYGDWLLHWPALSLEHRIQCFQHYCTYVIR